MLLHKDNTALAGKVSNASVKPQEAHAYNYTYIPPLAFIDQVPGVGFSAEWAFKVSIQLLKSLVNQISVLQGEPLTRAAEDLAKAEKFDNEGKHLRATLKMMDVMMELSKIRKDLDVAITDLKSVTTGPMLGQGAKVAMQSFIENMGNILAAKLPHGPARSIEDFNNLWKTIPIPKISAYFNDDQTFADLRVTGPNPTSLERVTAHLAKMPLTNEMFQKVMGADDDYDTAIKEGRVYMLDFAILNGALLGSYPQQQKYLEAPIAIFAVPKSGPEPRKMKAVAIQCGQIPGDNFPIIQPADEKTDPTGYYNWTMAKSVVNTADGNFHEAIAHLGRTHLVVEPFVVATMNQLPDDHPISMLLSPHFEGTLFINDAAQKALIAPGGIVDKLLGSTIDMDRVVAAIGCQSYLKDFNNSFFPNTIKARGVDDVEALPYYPYRDLAVQYWQIIHEWVSGYVSVYYDTEDAPADDTHLQAWMAELISHDGGRLANFGEDGAIRTRTYLAEVLTMVIFTAGPQHAAVNFPQLEVMAYVPAMPLAGYRKAPGSQPATEKDWMELLPPMDMTMVQMNTGLLLGGVYYTQLGQYKKGHFTDLKVMEFLSRFQGALSDLEAQILKDDPDLTYPFLLPSKVPQSINI